MSDVFIVQLEPHRWPQYKEIRLESLRTDPQAFGSSLTSMESKPDEYWEGRLREVQVGQKSWLLFAEEDTKLVGMIGAFVSDNSSEAEVISMYVSPEARGRGVSRQLLEALLSQLCANQVTRALLTVRKTQTAAIGLYRSFGFTPAGKCMDSETTLEKRI